MSNRSTALSRYAISEREMRHDGAATILKADTLPVRYPPPAPPEPPQHAGEGRLREAWEDREGATPSCRESRVPPGCGSRVNVISREQLQNCRHWQRAFASQHKDRRYYEIVEDTIHPEFDYWYFAIQDGQGEIQAVQPFFILDQDILAGVHPNFGRLTDAIRLQWPRFMFIKTMMIGCVAGEAHLDDGDDSTRTATARSMAGSIVEHARALGVRLIVLKEFPDQYRDALSRFIHGGFTRIPSMPQTRLNIACADFDDYMQSALNSATRRKLRKKFEATESDATIELSVTNDVTSIIDEIYPLYLQVYERSKLHFERLTKEYFCGLGTAMPARVRFFVWRRHAKAVAFGACMVHGDTLFAEYLGLDHRVALELHLYHYVFRDLVRWAIASGCRWFQSSDLNYDPKLHLRHHLKPVDLYVRHTSTIANMFMRAALPLLEPTRHDVTLKRFPNYFYFWGSDSAAGTMSNGAARFNSMTTANLRKGWGASRN
jgi:peptidoglycan biosynthesis/recognition FemAB-like protein